MFQRLFTYTSGEWKMPKPILLKNLVEWKEHGSVWQSKSGKFGSKNKRGKVKYFKEADAARAYSLEGATRSSSQVLNEEPPETLMVRRPLSPPTSRMEE